MGADRPIPTKAGAIHSWPHHSDNTERATEQDSQCFVAISYNTPRQPRKSLFRRIHLQHHVVRPPLLHCHPFCVLTRSRCHLIAARSRFGPKLFILLFIVRNRLRSVNEQQQLVVGQRTTPLVIYFLLQFNPSPLGGDSNANVRI